MRPVRWILPVVSLGVCLLVMAPPAAGQWPPNGTPLGTGPSNQAGSDSIGVTKIVSDGAGGAIVTWHDDRAGNWDIYAHHVLASGAVDPSWPANGLAVCTTPGNQFSPTIVSDGVGGAIVTWEDSRSGEADIYAQRVLAAGVVDPSWPADGVALSTAAGRQRAPTIVSDGAGGAIVVWHDERARGLELDSGSIPNGGVFQHSFATEGHHPYHCTIHGLGMAGAVTVAVGQPMAASVTIENNSYNPADVSVAPGGTVTWTNTGTTHTVTSNVPTPNWDVYAQRVLATGIVDPNWPADGLALCTAVDDQIFPHLVVDGAGGAIVAWIDERGAGDTRIFAHRALASGAVDPSWPADGRALCTQATGTAHQWAPKLISDGAGGAIVTWYDFREGPTGGIYAQRVLGSGAVHSGWPADSGRRIYAGPTHVPAIAPDGAGGAIIAWADARTGAGSGDIYAQRVLASGVVDPGWTPNGSVICQAAGNQLFPTIVADLVGGAVVTWVDGRDGSSGIYAQRVLATGVVDPMWPTDGVALCTAPGGQSDPTITSDQAGGALVTWIDFRDGNPDVYVKRVFDDGTPALAALVRAEARPDAVHLTWFTPDGPAVAAVVHRRTPETEWAPIARVVSDGRGTIVYEDRDVIAGGRYGYRLALSDASGEIHVGEAWLEVPAAFLFALGSVHPNPSAGAFTVSFSLATAEPGALEVFDVTGRRLLARGLDSPRAGNHVVTFEGGRSLPSGRYLVRLRQGGRSTTTDAVIVR